MDHWNYRVMKGKDFDGNDLFYITEVHYEGYEPVSYGIGAAAIGNSLEELEWTINKMKECLDKPVLEEW